MLVEKRGQVVLQDTERATCCDWRVGDSRTYWTVRRTISLRFTKIIVSLDRKASAQQSTTIFIFDSVLTVSGPRKSEEAQIYGEVRLDTYKNMSQQKISSLRTVKNYCWSLCSSSVSR